jgi:hypothetical protein
MAQPTKQIVAESAKNALQDLKVKVIDAIEKRVRKLGEHRVSPGNDRFDQLDLCEAGVSVSLTADNGDGESANFELQMIVVTAEKPHGHMTLFVSQIIGADHGNVETWGEEEILALDADTLICILGGLEEIK